jgi:hypothetical protein
METLNGADRIQNFYKKDFSVVAGNDPHGV